jgi:hypothetical protein
MAAQEDVLATFNWEKDVLPLYGPGKRAIFRVPGVPRTLSRSGKEARTQRIDVLAELLEEVPED